MRAVPPLSSRATAAPPGPPRRDLSGSRRYCRGGVGRPEWCPPRPARPLAPCRDLSRCCSGLATTTTAAGHGPPRRFALEAAPDPRLDKDTVGGPARLRHGLTDEPVADSARPTGVCIAASVRVLAGAGPAGAAVRVRAAVDLIGADCSRPVTCATRSASCAGGTRCRGGLAGWPSGPAVRQQARLRGAWAAPSTRSGLPWTRRWPERGPARRMAMTRVLPRWAGDDPRRRGRRGTGAEPYRAVEGPGHVRSPRDAPPGGADAQVGE